MYVYEQTTPSPADLPGILHATWAGEQEGLSQLSLWRQSMASGGSTPPHHHDCDEVVLCVAGQGELHVNGEVHRFGPNSTLVLPGGVPHTIVSVGPMPLETLGILASSPVNTYTLSGDAMALPWRT